MSDARPAGPGTIAVVMANHNGAAYLEQALHSVLSQTHRALEVVVVDDASTDRSVEIVTQLAAHDPRIRLLTRSTAGGAAVARNDAIETISADWVAICDSDDVIHPERLAHLLAVATASGADMVSDDSIHFASEPMPQPQSVIGLDTAIDEAEISLAELARRSEIGYLKPLIRRSLLAPRPYDETLAIGEDYQLYLDLVAAGAKLRLSDAGLYLYRRHPLSLSHRSQPDQIRQRRVRLQELDVTRQPDAARTRAALDTQCKQLMRAEAKESFVQALKRRQPLRALGVLARHPGPVLDWVTQAIGARANRRAGAPAAPLERVDLSAVDLPQLGSVQRRKTAELCYRASLGPITLVLHRPDDLRAAWLVPAAQGLDETASLATTAPRPLLDRNRVSAEHPNA